MICLFGLGRHFQLAMMMDHGSPRLAPEGPTGLGVDMRRAHIQVFRR